MKKHVGLKLAIGTLALVGVFLGASKASAAGEQPMYRLYNPNTGEHFYTANKVERSNLLQNRWQNEGVGWVAPTEGENVYRLYNPNSGDHHYTVNAKERDQLKTVGWNDEGVGWKSSTGKEIPLYRAYNKNAKVGSHNYTTNKEEQKNLIKAGWQDENIGWYGIKPGYQVDDRLPLDVNAYNKIMLKKVNELRASKGVAPLQYVDADQSYIDIRAKEISVKFDHVRPDGSAFHTVFPNNRRWLGENIAMSSRGYNESEEAVATRFFNLWASSPSHYQNMTNPSYEYFLSSLCETKGQVFVVQIFGFDIPDGAVIISEDAE